jgi:prepilin-type N-terminal cleavage/methylation domain-containing protein
MTFSKRGFSYVELLAAVLLVSIASAAALASWSISTRAPANKRATEMGVYVGVQALERLKARKYLGVNDTAENAPLVTFYDRYGALAGAAAERGYTVRAWIRPMVSRDAVLNTEDLREIEIKVYNNALTEPPYEHVRTLLTFGGV